MPYQALEEALIACERPSALLLTSVDDLFGIGQAHGLRAMEAARHEFRARLMRIKRGIDSLIALTDDLVCLVVRDLEHLEHALLAANRVESVFRPTFEFGEKIILLKPTAGLVYFESCHDQSDADLIFRQASRVRSSAYHSRKYCEWELFDRDQPAAGGDPLLADFDRALDAAEFSLDYQPQYRLHDGELVGIEALVRWRSDQRVVPPDLFLPLLTSEQHWALFQYTFRLAIRNREQLPYPISTAINLDPIVLSNPELVGFVERDSAIWGLDPSQITFEVTESATVENFDTANRTLHELMAMGFATSIDDFGSQHASFEHLMNLPANEVKIDRQFVARVVQSRDDQEVVRGVIDMCHRFEKTVVAEGIEDGRTVERLIDLQCDYGQGYYLGMPMSVVQLSELLGGLDPKADVSSL